MVWGLARLLWVGNGQIRADSAPFSLREYLVPNNAPISHEGKAESQGPFPAQRDQVCERVRLGQNPRAGNARAG